MRICYLNTLYEPNVRGGAERSVQALAEKMSRLGHEVSVITSSASAQEHTEVLNGVRVHYLPQRNVYRWPQQPGNQALKLAWHIVDTYNPLMALKVRQLLRRGEPELLHTNTIGGFSTAVWDAARLEGVPVVHTLRDYYLLCPQARMFENGQNCAGQCLRCSAFSLLRKARSQRVPAVVGVSNYTLQRHLQAGYFRQARIARVIHNIYERPSHAGVSETASSGELRLGYLGQLHPSKGLEQFAEIFATLPEKQIRVVIAGKGTPEYEAELRAKFATGRVEFLGFVPPEQLFAQIDILLVPAQWQEPLPRIIFEAYSFGIPVIASRRGGQPEIVEEGKTGYLYEPEHPAELSALLGRITVEECRAMRPHCLEAAGEFSSDHIIRQYQEVYDAVRARADEPESDGVRAA